MPDSLQRLHGAGGRVDGAAGDAYELQRVVSSVGFLALFGVSVQTGIIMLEYINQTAGARAHSVEEAAVEGAVLQSAADHDDDACGDAGAAAGGDVAWDWV